MTRDEALAHCRAIVEATDLPVSADLEKGFGDEPESAAETIRLAADIGLVGGSIEDATGQPDRPLYDVGLATQRIAAAVAAARALPFAFTLTARAEGFLRGNPDLDDVIARLLAFERAGADVLMAPGLPTSRQFGPCARRSRSRSTSWSGSPGGRSPWLSSRRLVSAGSASRRRSIVLR